MKKQLLLLAVILVAATLVSNAQGGPGGGGMGMRRTVEERVKVIHQKMDSAFKYDAAKQAQIDTLFANHYRKSDKAREEAMNGGGDRSAMREKMQAMTDERDKELAVLLGEANFKIWKESIEPAMMPRRGPGGGGPGGNRQ